VNYSCMLCFCFPSCEGALLDVSGIRQSVHLKKRQKLASGFFYLHLIPNFVNTADYFNNAISAQLLYEVNLLTL